MASIRWTDEDESNLKALKDRGETDTDTVRKSLKWARRFQHSRAEALVKIRKQIGWYDIPPEEFLDVGDVVSRALDKASGELLRESKRCKVRDQKKIIKNFREKWRKKK